MRMRVRVRVRVRARARVRVTGASSMKASVTFARAAPASSAPCSAPATKSTLRWRRYV